MPVRGTGEQEQKWNFAVRSIPEIPVDRAKLRLTGTYAVMPGLFVGVEYNPLDDDIGPLVNWRIVDETKYRPMVMVGTSSDRIGTPSGRAYYATFAKSLDPFDSIPFSPYVGASYGEFDEEVVVIGGLGIRWTDDIFSTHAWDGHNLHHMIDYYWESRYRVGFVLAQQDSDYYGGISVGVGL